MDDSLKKCKIHGKKLYLYCETCSKALCILCVPEHNGEGHKVIDYQTFYQNFSQLQSDYEEASSRILKLTDEFTSGLDKFVARKRDEIVKINEDYEGLVQVVQDFKGSITDNFENSFESEVSRVSKVKDSLAEKASETNEKYDLVKKLKSDLGNRFTGEYEYFHQETDFVKLKDLGEYVKSLKETLEKEYAATIQDISSYEEFFGTNARINKKLSTLLTDNYQFKPVSLKVNSEKPQLSSETEKAAGQESAKHEFFVSNSNMWYKACVGSVSEENIEYLTSYFVSYNTVIVSSINYTRAEVSKTTNLFGMVISEAESKKLKEAKKETFQIVGINGYFYKLISYKTVSDTTYEVEYSYPPTTYKTTAEKSGFEIKHFVTFETLGETEVEKVLKEVSEQKQASVDFEEGEKVVIDWYGFFPGEIEEKEESSWRVKVFNSGEGSVETVYDSESYKIFKVIDEKTLSSVTVGAKVIVKLHTNQWGEFEVAAIGDSDITVKTGQSPELLIKFPQPDGPSVALKSIVL